MGLLLRSCLKTRIQQPSFLIHLYLSEPTARSPPLSEISRPIVSSHPNSPKPCSPLFSVYAETFLFFHFYCYYLVPTPSPLAWVTAVGSALGSLFLSLTARSLSTKQPVWSFYTVSQMASLLCSELVRVCQSHSEPTWSGPLLLWPCLLSLPPCSFYSNHIGSLLLLGCTKHAAATPGHFHLLSSLPRVFYPQISVWLLPCFFWLSTQLSSQLVFSWLPV